MKHIIAVLFMLLGASLISSAQQRHRLPVKVERVTVRHTDPHHKTELKRHLAITITNDSGTSYYFWVGHNPTDSNDNDRMLIRKYFKMKPDQYKDDPSYLPLSFWIWDQNVNFPPIIEPEIGCDFLKLLFPGDKFILNIPDDKDSLSYYYRRLVFVPRSVVLKIMGE
ncbi:MAG: hypothetical protein K2M76_07000, partial [Muribaculaceae bacterium]|nr:hypothetical protein [Muribaculaceae bacterium]